MSVNYSGFGGHSISNLYPNFGSGVTQNLDTVPEPEEQVAYVSTDAPAPAAVDGKTKLNMFVLFGVLLLLIILFR